MGFNVRTDEGELVEIVEKGISGDRELLRAKDGRTFTPTSKPLVVTQLPEEKAAMAEYAINTAVDLAALDTVIDEAGDVVDAAKTVIDEVGQAADVMAEQAGSLIEQSGTLVDAAVEEGQQIADAGQAVIDEAGDVVDAVQDVLDGPEGSGTEAPGGEETEDSPEAA